MSDIVYGYFQVKHTKRGTGYVCVRLERPPKGSVGQPYRASFAFCSPLDHFSKRLARRITDARAKTQRVNATIEFKLDGEQPKLEQIFRRALQLAQVEKKPFSDKTFAPDWVKRSTLVFGLHQELNYPKLDEAVKAAS